MIFFTKYFISI